MKLEFGLKYFLKCVLTDSVNNSILKKIDFGLNGPDRVTYYIVSLMFNDQMKLWAFFLYSANQRSFNGCTHIYGSRNCVPVDESFTVISYWLIPTCTPV